MNALFIASAIWSLEGGMERFNRRFARVLSELAESGAYDRVVALDMAESPSHKREVPAKLDLIGCGDSKVRVALAFLWYAFRYQPRAIFYGYVGFAPLAIFVKILNPRARQFVLVHGVEVWRTPPPIRKWSIKHIIDRVIAVSEFTIGQMSSYFELDRSKFRRFLNALDVGPRVEKRLSPNGNGRFPGTHKILTVTRLHTRDSYKNVDKVILSMPEILERFPDTHYFVIGDGPWKPELEQLAAKTGVEERIHFMGNVDDETRDRAYEVANLFVMPSTGEGFGIVFLEAWNVGLACVSSDRDAAAEVIRDGVDGLCVEPTPRAISGAIQSLLADPEKCLAMGASGRERLETEFSHQKYRERLHAILQEHTACGA